ncbi:MAG: phospholipid carrier-dependent glycosyltransferase [Chloroflexi bacterium]|nr:MAG: phospholipid carrier-dependent glycosyltransferase [Chloroflexota bacterium]
MDAEQKLDIALALGVLALALIGQFFFSKVRGDSRDGLIFFALAVVLFLILAMRSEAEPTQEGPRTSWLHQAFDSVRGEPVRAALVVLSFALAYTTVRLLKAKPGTGSYWDAFALWGMGGLCIVAAFADFSRVDLRSWFRRHRLELVVVTVMTLTAGALRFVALGTIPDVVSGDEGKIGMLALSVLKGELNNMMATIFGHSTMYIFAMAGAMKLFGVNVMGLRLLSALGGTLTVPALYVLARRMFGVRVAVIAAALLTVSHFHLHFSRIIVAGSIQDALFATLAFYFFLTGLEERSPFRFVLSALVIGIHLYIYMGARLLILLLPAYVFALWITDQELVRENLGNLLTFVGALIVMSAPMALWAVEHTAEFMARANQVGIIQSGWLANEAHRTGQSQFSILVHLLVQAFLTVNYYPAKAFYNSTLPMLDFLSGATFILGLAYSLYHITDRRHLLLNAWFWSGIVVGGALVVLPADAAYRIMIIFPAVCIFAALGWDRLIEFGVREMPAKKVTMNAFTAVFIVLVTVLNLKAYFIDYAQSCRYEDWGTRFASYMGEYLGTVGPEYKAYLMGAPRIRYGIHRSVDFLSEGTSVTNVDERITSEPTFVDPNSKVVFIFIPDRQNELTFVKQYMPGGKVLRKYDCGNLMMVIYQVDGSSS